MRLIIISRIEKEFVLAKALATGFGAKDILEAHHFTKCFWSISDIEFKKPSKLPGAQARIKRSLNIQYTVISEDDANGFIEPVILINFNSAKNPDEPLIEEGGYIGAAHVFVKAAGDECCCFRQYIAKFFKFIADGGGVYLEQLREHSWEKASAYIMKAVLQRKFSIFFAETHYPVIHRVIKFEIDIDATISYHPIDEWLMQRRVCPQLPITVDIPL